MFFVNSNTVLKARKQQRQRNVCDFKKKKKKKKKDKAIKTILKLPRIYTLSKYRNGGSAWKKNPSYNWHLRPLQ